MSLKIVSHGLSSGLRLGRLVQFSRSRRISDCVTCALIGCAGSRSKAIRTDCPGYHRRTRRRNRQTYTAPLPGKKVPWTKPRFTS